MTISTFANQCRRTDTGWPDGRPIRARYQDAKHEDAEQRQAAFDAKVEQVVAEQNCHPRDARRVVNARRLATHHARG